MKQNITRDSRLIATWDDEEEQEVRIVNAFALADASIPIEIEKVHGLGWLVGTTEQCETTEVYQTSRFVKQSQLRVEPGREQTFEEIRKQYGDQARCEVCGSLATEVIDYERGMPQFYCDDCEHGWYADPQISSFDGVLYEKALIVRKAVRVERESGDAVAKFLSEALNKIVHTEPLEYGDGTGELVVTYDDVGLYLPYGSYVYIGAKGEVFRYVPEFENAPDLNRFGFLPNNMRE